MNKKNWKKRFEGLDFMVKVKDSFGWTKEINYEMLEDFIQQEIDRANLDLLRKILDREGYTDETIVNRMGKEFARLSKLTK